MTTSSSVRYGVNDLGLATALACSKFEIVDLVPNPNSDRVTFYFEPSKNIDLVAKEYWSGKLTVNARQFWGEMKNLKTRLYSLR